MTTLPTDPPVARIDSLATLVASGFGSGLAPVAPGTAGSVAAALALALTLGAPLTLHWTLWLTSVGLAIWSAGNAGRAWGVIDHPAIVIDEVVGLWVAILIPMTLLTGPQSGWVLVMGALLLFRLFDIAKPWPVNQLERSVSGGWGVVLDDVAAGVMAGFSLTALLIGLSFL